MPFKSLCPRSFFSISRPRLKHILANSLFLPQRPTSPSQPQKHPHVSAILPAQTVVFDVEGWLLRSSSPFPYFLLVALECCSIFRALILLLSYPLLLCLEHEAATRMMVMLCFCGVRKQRWFRAGRTVLPRLFLKDVGEEGFDVLRMTERRVAVTGMPRVMVESFLKDYLDVQVVVGKEEEEEKEEELRDIVNGGEVLGFGLHGREFPIKFFPNIKEVYRVTDAEKRNWHHLPMEKCPKPLIFHDGRIAFQPTFTASIAMFVWFPFGVILSILRSILCILLPYSICIPVSALTGLVGRLVQTNHQSTSEVGFRPASGRLYICNHRTLLDPIYISVALNRPVTAVVYSVSPISEFLSPIKTARLTRNREEDRCRMAKLLKQGDLVVCPEGTTCREPFLLRFSPLFAELADRVTPVALSTEVSMFYGTTTSGFKWLDSFYFLMNPRPSCVVQFLNEMPTVSENGRWSSPCEVANHIQREIGRALDFTCTKLTRKDKYQILAGNDGVLN
ncbi:hypothetical protein HPP92_001224 [Vanilla planifolia]|uniref:Phospholipid/glycerol acyltransferase domain-containing protein n=1 Tax=Vanilla planifolia TaxID=51239 RepID=A0A835S2Z7_VANPL|nr:hypothetical protein HPP92_001224 [Vanilla planifolia]